MGAHRRRRQSMPLIIREHVEVTPEELVNSFRQFDVDRSGIIDFDEFKTLVLLNIGPKVTDERIKEMMIEISGSLMIDFQAFKSYVQKNPDMFNRKLGILERVFHTLEEPGTSLVAKAISMVIMIFIFVSCGAFVVESMPESTVLPADCRLGGDCEPLPKGVFADIETVCVVVFTIEYLLRVCTFPFETTNLALRSQFMMSREIDSDAGKAIASVSLQNKWKRQMTYMTSSMNLVDFVSIAPFYIEKMVSSEGGVGLTFFRVLRLARVFRIFKMGKYAEGMGMLTTVMKASSPAFGILLFFALIGCCFFGALIFFFEKGTFRGPDFMCFPDNNQTCAEGGHPEGAFFRKDVVGTNDEISPFVSIPHCFWWVLTTATTVGYGDLYPTSGGGKLIGAITMTLGIVVLALPISVVGANFAAEYNKREREKEADRQLARGDAAAAMAEAAIGEGEEGIADTPADGGLVALGEPLGGGGTHKIHPSPTAAIGAAAGAGGRRTSAGLAIAQAALNRTIMQCQMEAALEREAFLALQQDVSRVQQLCASHKITGAHVDRFTLSAVATIGSTSVATAGKPSVAALVSTLRGQILSFAAELARASIKKPAEARAAAEGGAEKSEEEVRAFE
eukprot:g922.t1